jgi:type II secretory ATPase GspE/PulE/Tfp pilus assembly ATPase PilB-like protein
LETAEISIQAALTGHLVLSTLHTNDAAGTVPRLLSMGSKPFLLAPALNAMIGQRLVRRLCEDCKEEKSPDAETMKRIKEALEKLPGEEKAGISPGKAKFYVGRGCDKCQGIGYKGRIGIYEILTMNEEVSKMILSNKSSEYDMRSVGIKYGMVTMIQDGLLKAAQGITSIDEVFRVAKEI